MILKFFYLFFVVVDNFRMTLKVNKGHYSFSIDTFESLRLSFKFKYYFGHFGINTLLKENLYYHSIRIE